MYIRTSTDINAKEKKQSARKYLMCRLYDSLIQVLPEDEYFGVICFFFNNPQGVGGCECEGREGAGLEPDVRLRARGCGRVFARGLAEARTAEAAGPRARRAIPTPDTTRRDAFNPLF